MAFLEVDEDNIHQVLNQEFDKNNIVILKFGSEFCDPCHALECELEELDNESENISILMIDTDVSPDLAEQYEVYQLPTMIIYKNRTDILYHQAGVILAQDIKAIIEN